MAKIATDIFQSKKLAEILPLESADMCYVINYAESNKFGKDQYELNVDTYGLLVMERDNIPCWSLSSLLCVLPDEITDDGDVYRNMFFHLKGKYIIQYPRLTTLWPSLLSVDADNPVDACYELILKLNELNIL